MATQLDSPRGAILSPDETYRYRLWRTITHPDQGTLDGRRDHSTVAFVLLNPSTADATTDDPTLRRCIGFAERWGYDRVELGNLFAYRAKKPDELEDAEDPIGPANQQHLKEICLQADRVVVGWGAHDIATTLGLTMVATVMGATGGRLYCLGTTNDGNPRHPLYVKGDTDPRPWEVDE